MFAFVSIVFAQDYSIKKFNEIRKNGDEALQKYCFQANVSNESNYNHMYQYIKYVSNGKKLTLDEINNNASKFNKINKRDYNLALVVLYSRNGFDKQALALVGNNNELKMAYCSNYLIFLLSQPQKDCNKIWSVSSQLLINNNIGDNNYKRATKALNNMFRYKPSNITKEEQIKFLTKISEIYPIPGTDFNQWKSFMGFVGFKYKQLTGKDLY